MVENKCLYEQVAKETSLPFISIKNHGQSTLVFNPILIDQALSQIAYELCGKTKVNLDVLKRICSECRICQPDIQLKGSSDYRIFRHNYGYIEENHPLAQFTHFPPEGEEDRNTRVVLVDDDPFLDVRARTLGEDGFDTFYVLINNGVPVSQIAQRDLFTQIIDLDPHCVISDKGLGYVDGILLIDACKKAGIPTIMVTGEYFTNETRKVASRFLTKPVDYHHLLAAIEELTHPK